MISVFFGELGAFGTAAGETTVDAPSGLGTDHLVLGVLFLEHGFLVGEGDSLGRPRRGYKLLLDHIDLRLELDLGGRETLQGHIGFVVHELRGQGIGHTGSQRGIAVRGRD